MVIDVGYWTKVCKRILILLATLAVLYLSFKLAIFYIPFLIAFIIAVMVEPLIKLIVKKTHITRKKVAAFAITIIFAIIIGIICWGAFILITESANLLQKLNVYIDFGTEKVNEYIDKIRTREIKVPEQVISIMENSSDKIINTITNFIYDVLTKVTHIIALVPEFAIYTFITILATYFICTDRMYIIDQMEHHLPSLWAKKIGIHLRNIIKSLGDYLKAEVILIIISFFIVLIGLYILKFTGNNIQYPLLAALGIGIVDALPILGSGMVMIPWAIIVGINGNLSLGIYIMIVYIVATVVRQLIEPKIVSHNIGIHPIFTLIAMYTGFKLSGVLGLFIGPIIFIILKNIFSVSLENGLIRSIFL